jgi:hypothetical protein
MEQTCHGSLDCIGVVAFTVASSTKGAMSAHVYVQ